MSAGAFTLYKNSPREKAIERVSGFLRLLGMDADWEVKVEKKKRTRSLSQNAYLWGVCYATILDKGGNILAGWTADDLHDYLLGEHFGWEVLEAFGKRRLRPIKRSSKLSTFEFMQYVDFIQRRMAEHGIYIPSPNESQL